ncbi:MAG: cation:proton antiporter, partial [Bacilli bacterium]
LLLALATLITAVAKKLNQPYPIALVVVGAIIGLVPIAGLESLKDFVAEDEVFRFAIISIFLPTLLGEATLKLPFTHLKTNQKPILALAFGGTLLSYVLIGFSSNIFLDLSIPVAFVFAALMSATDPVSVISIFKSVGVDNRLATVIEGESLFNDGIAVVLFSISAFHLIQYMDAGWIGFGYGLLEFIKVAAGGLIIGGVLAFLFSQLIRFFDDYPLEIVISMLLFYGSFFIAEHFHVSGVIAVVTAGLIFGNYGAKIGMTPTTKLNINSFWDVLALLANSLVFLMVGLEITRINMSDKWGLIAIAIGIVIVSRSVAVYGSLAYVRNIPSTWKHVLNWGGLKGSLSIALALSLPHDFAGREEVLVLTFSVVLFSLVVQGLTIKPLIAWLKVKAVQKGITEYEEAISRIHRNMNAIDRLKMMKEEALISNVVYEKLDQEYEEKLGQGYITLEQLYVTYPHLKEEQLEMARVQALYSEREAVEKLARRHIISDSVAEKERERVIDLLES